MLSNSKEPLSLWTKKTRTTNGPRSYDFIRRTKACFLRSFVTKKAPFVLRQTSGHCNLAAHYQGLLVKQTSLRTKVLAFRGPVTPFWYDIFRLMYSTNRCKSRAQQKCDFSSGKFGSSFQAAMNVFGRCEAQVSIWTQTSLGCLRPQMINRFEPILCNAFLVGPDICDPDQTNYLHKTLADRAEVDSSLEFVESLVLTSIH